MKELTPEQEDLINERKEIEEDIPQNKFLEEGV